MFTKMVLETDNKKGESKEKFRRRSSFPMRSETPLRFSTTLSLQILRNVNKVCEGLPQESLPVIEVPISHSPTKSDGSNNESGYSEYSSPSRITKSATFTVQAMDIDSFIHHPKSLESQPENLPESQNDEKDGNKIMETTSEEKQKKQVENIHLKPSPSPSDANTDAEDETKKHNEVDADLCDSGAESASPEKDLNKQQPSTEIATMEAPVKNGKGKFGGLKKRKSLDKSSRKTSLRQETTKDVSPPPSLSSTSTPTEISTSLHNGRGSSSSPPLSLSLSLPVHEDGSSISSIVEYEGAKKIPKKANIETMRAMGLTEERKPKLSSRSSFKIWKRSALQYIKSHASNVSKGKMYRMNAGGQTKKDDIQHYKNENTGEQQHISINGDNQLSLQIHNPDANNDLSPMEEYKSNCGPMYKCYPIHASPYSDEKTRKWRRVRRAFSELYPSRCIDPRISDDEPNNRKSDQKASKRKTLMSNASSQFDLRTLGAIEIDVDTFVSDSFNSEIISLQGPGQNKDYTDSFDKKSNKDDKSKLDKNSLFEAPCDTEVTPKSELPVLPLNSNGLNQTAPHRIDLQKYVINPNRENCRRSSLANIPTANSSAQNIYVPQKEQQSKSLECSRTESELKEETISLKEEKSAFDKVVTNEEFPSISRESSSTTFQLINVSSNSTSTTSTPTTNTSPSQYVSSFSTSQMSSCSTSNNLTSSSSSATTSSDDATVSPTFEEYAKAHGGMNFGLGHAMHGGLPSRDHQITSRGVTANLTPTHERARRSSISTVNRATSPMNCEIQKEIFNKQLQMTNEEPKNITRSSFPEGFRRTQEISCRLLSPDEATAIRNTNVIPSKLASPGLMTTRYLRNTEDIDMMSGKTDSNVCLALSPSRKSKLDEGIDKKETENEKHSHEDILKMNDTTISDLKTVVNDQEPAPVPPPRRRLKENPQGTPNISPSILKKNVLVSNRSQSPDIQEGKSKEKKEPDSPSLTKIPTSRRSTNNQDSPVGSGERSASPFSVRKISKPVSPSPKRDLSPRPMRASKSMPSSPDLNASRDLRIAGGLPSSPESTPRRTTRTKSHIPSCPETPTRISRAFANRQPSPETATPKRSRIATEKTTNPEPKEDEIMPKDSDAQGASLVVKSNSNRIPFSEAAPLKNSRMTTMDKQVNPDANVTKNNRVMTPKRINVNTGLQLVSRPTSVKSASTDPLKNSRIPVSKSTRPDVIPKKSGRLAINRLVNPTLTAEKCLKTVNNKAEHPVSENDKYSQPRSEETFIPSPGNSSERHEMARTVSCEVETGSPTHHSITRLRASNSTRTVSRDFEHSLTSNEVRWSPSTDLLFKSLINKSESGSYEMEGKKGGQILGLTREEINQTRKKSLLMKTISCEAVTGSPTGSPTKSLEKTSSPHLMITNVDVEESPSPIGGIKKQDAAAQTTNDEINPRDGEVVTTSSPSLSTLKQDMAAQTYENELQSVLSTGVCGMVSVPVVTRQTPHQIKMGGAALRARANTDPSEINGPKPTSKSLDHRWEISNYTEHVQQLMVVEEGQARLYDLKPASCQSIQLLSPSEYSLGSITSTENSSSTDPHITESASVDRCLGSLANTRYRYNLSNSMAGGLDAIGQSSADQTIFESSSSLKDSTNLEIMPRRRRAASLSNIEFPRKVNDKKNRKRSRLSTFLDKFHRKKKPTLVSDDVDLPTHFRVIGRILEMCLDGTRIIELTQPPHGLCGIYMTRVKHSYGYGIYVSRFCDGYPAKMFAGLLAIGDQILEINGISTDKITVEEAHDMVASRDTLILRVLPNLTNYRVSTLPR